MFCKKGVLRNFAEFTGKHQCPSLFFSKVAGLRPGTLLKKRLWLRCFPVNFAKLLRTPFLTEHLWWLLLPFGQVKPFTAFTKLNFVSDYEKFSGHISDDRIIIGFLRNHWDLQCI